MTRHLSLVLVAACAVGAFSSPARALPEVKVSLSREDPDLRTMKTDAELVEFYIWIDGIKTRGMEAGIYITGGDFYGYILDDDHAWIPFPMANAYPGTVSQVLAGSVCLDPPTFAGRMLIKPHEPGKPVYVDVVPSQNDHALIVTCLNQATTGLKGYPAAINAEPREAQVIRGRSPGGAEVDMYEFDTTPGKDDDADTDGGLD